ncbi:MAG: hypothetical protein K6F73_06290 [Lachnospiraceae bacterium]|nr:hypothetical protein [Lachnospiraceae bacterium]
MAKTVHLCPAQCALDIGDGSERGEYVCQDYILNVLGRPHRAVNIMYTYYPNDSQWPARISEACAVMEVGFAWDYPYDDYYPFVEDGAQFEQMRDIRRHGQDVMLTMTIDCSLDDEKLRALASKLRPYGRMLLRINHECNGNWFTHNKRFSHEEIASFFVRFSRIIKEEAPNVRTVFCAGLISKDKDENGKYMVEYEDEFAPAYLAADVWSADKYLALHFGWPYNIAEAREDTYTADGSDKVFEWFLATYERLSQRFGNKPFIQAEMNADGDVTSPIYQTQIVRAFYDLVKNNKAGWLTGISMYQFRDRGRLGLEVEDPNNSSVGIRQPLMDEYIKILRDPYFSPRMEEGSETAFPAKLRWGGSEDADGIEIAVEFDPEPSFCEVTLQEDLCLMMEFNGRWFFKAKGVATIDLMPAFFEKRPDRKCTVPLRIFATPPDGENHDDGTAGWTVDQHFVMNEEPKLRIRYQTPYQAGAVEK